MPDPALETPESDLSARPYDPRRQPINDALGYHPFVESEFAQGAGRCDRCGGGPDAEIHQKPVDQMARIADALERIADFFPSSSAMQPLLNALMSGIEKALSTPSATDPFATFLEQVFNPQFVRYFQSEPDEDGGEAFADWIFSGYPEWWERILAFLNDFGTIERCPMKDAPGFIAFVEGIVTYDPEAE